jgi:hypothetical protein
MASDELHGLARRGGAGGVYGIFKETVASTDQSSGDGSSVRWKVSAAVYPDVAGDIVTMRVVAGVLLVAPWNVSAVPVMLGVAGANV